MRLWQILSTLVPAYFAKNRGERLYRACLALDGAVLKFGQTASFRSDLVKADIVPWLAKLQGERGVATVGVVVREGDRAVKTIPPGRRELVERDLRLLKRIGFIAGWLPILCRLRLSEMVDEVGFALRRELDLSVEGENQRVMRKQLAGRHGIYVPYVYAATRDRLETEWIEGEDLSAYASDPWRLANGAQRVVELLFHLLRMMFEDNRYHGDLHRGNVRVMADGRFALLDFGAVGVTEHDFLQHFSEFIEALGKRQWKWAANQFAFLQRDLVPRSQIRKAWHEKKLTRVERGLTRVIGRWCTGTGYAARGFHERSLNTLVLAMVWVTSRAGASLSWDWTPLQRALQAIEGIVELFYPAIDYVRVARRYLREQAERGPAFCATAKEAVGRVMNILDDWENQGIRVNA